MSGTYQRTGADLHLGGLEDGAVAGGHNSVLADERAAAEVGATGRQADDEGEVADLGGLAADNLAIAEVEARLVKGATHGEGGHRQGDGESELSGHCD